MIPIVDMHCHLLAGLDDGPKVQAEALEMCRMLAEQGVSSVLALAHQNEHYPAVTPERIRAGALTLKEEVRNNRLPIAIFPGAEVMIHPDFLSHVRQQSYLTISDAGKFFLIEFPHGVFLDLREIIYRLIELGIRPILAHPEQSPELLFSEQMAEQWVRMGCLFQLSTGNVLGSPDKRSARAIKGWVQRGFYHVIGSDGHSPSRRPPLLAEASRVIASWLDPLSANRLCGMNGMAILQGLPLKVDPPTGPRTLFWLMSRWLKK